MLPLADVVVMIAPHTPQTDNMLGAAEFATMRDGAFFINIGRGATVDEPALIAALHAGKLGGAALDVFAEEPLPADSPLWEMDSVLVSPHSASTSDRENERITDLFCDNLRRYLDGRPLRNVLGFSNAFAASAPVIACHPVSQVFEFLGAIEDAERQWHDAPVEQALLESPIVLQCQDRTDHFVLAIAKLGHLSHELANNLDARAAARRCRHALQHRLEQTRIDDAL